MKDYKFETKSEFLWLPKKIYGKWFWLQKVTVIYKVCNQVVDGKEVEFVVSKEYLGRDDYEK